MSQCKHVPSCLTCCDTLCDPPGGPFALTTSRPPPRFFYRSDEAAQHVEAGRQVVMSVDNPRLDQTTGKVVLRGKRFCAFGVHEAAAYYASRGCYHRHLYESLRTGVPYKPVMDLDRALGGSDTLVDLDELQDTYVDVFLPLVLAFFGKLLGCDVDARSLDASLRDKKFSKHLVLHATDGEGRLWAYDERGTEMQVMSAFRQHIEAQADQDERLANFYYFVDKGRVQTIVDYAIYHHGKRDMRLVGSCKAAGKRKGAPLRTLLPESNGTRPFCEFLCNVFGVPTSAIRAPGGVKTQARKRKQRARGRPEIASSTTGPAKSFAPSCETSEQLTRLAVAAGAVGDVRVRVKDDTCWVVPINYAADNTGRRMCLFMVPHSRHWAQLRCTFAAAENGGQRSVLHVTYYCHGCGTSVPLYDASQAATARERLLGRSSARDTTHMATLAQRSGLDYEQVHSRYVPPLDMHSCDQQTVVLKSGMGSGKTSRIAEYLEALPTTLSVLCVGYRRVLNSALAERFDLLDYQMAEPAELPLAKRLCVQVDSLPRLLAANGGPDEKALRAVFDIVIVDEVESTLDHFAGSTLDGKVLLCWKIFAIVLQRATKVILADADADQRVVAVVSALRTGGEGSLPRVIENTATDSAKDMCTCFVWMSSFHAFFERACHYLQRGKRVYLASNSRAMAHAFRSLALNRSTRCSTGDDRPWLLHEDVLLVDKDVPEHEKRRVRECNTTWLSYKLIICTPTVGAGIDFCVKGHIDATFVYATDKSTTPREVNQQRGRVRFPTDKRCYMLVDTHYSTLLDEDVDQLQERLEERSDVVVTDLIEQQQTRDSEWLGLRLSKTPDLLLRLFALHEAEVNASRNNMRLALYKLLREKYPSTPHVVLSGNVLGTDETHARHRAHAESLAYKREHAETLLQQHELTPEEARELNTMVITASDDDEPFAKERLHMQSIRDFYPLIREWSVTDVLVLGHPAFIQRVRCASVLLGGATLEAASADALSWRAIRVSGAAQFSLAHRTALERREPAQVTRLFFSLFAYFAGLDVSTAANGDLLMCPTSIADVIGRLFAVGAALHSALAQERIEAHPLYFVKLERRFGQMRDSKQRPCRQKVRQLFRKHVESVLGVRFACTGKHKHVAVTHGTGTEYCHRTRPCTNDVVGLLFALHASCPADPCGLLAASLLVQHTSLAQQGTAATGPYLCSVRNVGMAAKPPRTAAATPSTSNFTQQEIAASHVGENWVAVAESEIQRVRRMHADGD